MATVTLAGKLIDITTKPVEEVTTVTVKAPKPDATSVGTITSKPQKVDLSSDGSFSLTVAEGTGWLYVEGPGWSDSIRFVAKAGMSLFEQARLNAGPWPVPLPLAEEAVGLITKALQDALNAIAGAGTGGTSLIPDGTNWDTLTSTGIYRRRYNTSNDTNAPTDAAGILYVGDPENPGGGLQTQLYLAASMGGVFYRSAGSTGSWGPWQRIDIDERIDDADTMMVGDARRAAVVQAGIARRGVSIGTGGLGAIALRFDHHLDSFGTKVLPLLKKYRLPWGQMLNYSGIGNSDDNWTWSKIATECHNSGGEVWNHSWSHSGVETKEQARREVALGLSELKNNLPSLWIDSFAPPGQPDMDGFEGQDTPEKFWNSHYGRMVLATHAFSRGYWPGSYQPLHAPNLIGAPHATIDKQSVAWVKGYVAGAMRSKTGATIMLHPNYLDTTDYMTTAQLEDILSYIADLRDTGQIQVLSCAGILVGDIDLPVNRTNHLENAEAGSVNSSQTWTVSERVGKDNFGVPHEATAWVRATAAGTLTLTVTVNSPTNPISQTHTVTATAGQVVRLGVVVTPPMDTTAQTVQLVGNVTHTGVIYRPI